MGKIYENDEITMFGLVKLSGLALLGLSVVTFGSAFRGAPAIDQNARIDNVAGEWRVSTDSAMYYPAEHLFQIGQSYLSSGLVVGEDGEFGAASFNLEEELARKEKAVELLQESLSHRPGNAYAWTSLAWAHSTSTNYDAFFAALENSWKFAPHNAQLALDRLLILETVASFESEELLFQLLSDRESEILTDLSVTQQFKPRELEEVLLLSLVLPELMEKLDSQAVGDGSNG